MDDFKLKILESAVKHSINKTTLLAYTSIIFNKKDPITTKNIIKPLQEIFIDKLSEDTDEGFVISLKE